MYKMQVARVIEWRNGEPWTTRVIGEVDVPKHIDREDTVALNAIAKRNGGDVLTPMPSYLSARTSS